MSGSELLRPSPSQRNASAVDEGGESGGDPLSNMEDTFGRSSTSQFPLTPAPQSGIPHRSVDNPTAVDGFPRQHVGGYSNIFLFVAVIQYSVFVRW